MELPLVSVVMPIYNAENFLDDSISSILNQTYKNFELILINDNSNDNSLKIIEEYQKKDDRIIVYSFQTKQNIPIARNKALEIAKGKYMANLDADDIANHDSIEKQVDILEKNENIVVIGSDIQFFGSNQNKWLTKHNHHAIICELLFGAAIPNSCPMVRKYTIDKYNIRYDESLIVGSDYDFWQQISNYGELINLNEILTYVRKHTNNTSSNQQERKKSTISIHKKILKDNLNMNPTGEESALHYQLNKFEKDYEMNYIFLNHWLCKIFEANKITKYYNEIELKKILQEKLLHYLAGKVFDNKENYYIFTHSVLSPYHEYSFFQKIKVFLRKFI